MKFELEKAKQPHYYILRAERQTGEIKEFYGDFFSTCVAMRAIWNYEFLKKEVEKNEKELIKREETNDIYI
tara:strand:+ start:23 stop:235 length:213 start_codon:yes stop_codon:yes gene_type:complete